MIKIYQLLQVVILDSDYFKNVTSWHQIDAFNSSQMLSKMGGASENIGHDLHDRSFGRPQRAKLSGRSTSGQEMMNTKSTNEKIKLSSKSRSANYGFLKISLSFILSIMPLTIIHIVEAVNNYREAIVLENCIQLYTTFMVCWNNMELSRVSVTYALLFNDRYLINGSTPQETFRKATNILVQETIPAMKAMRQYDFGGFTMEYLNLTGEGTYCQFAMKYTQINYQACGKGATAFINTNLLGVVNNYVSALQNMMNIALDANKNDMMLESMFNNEGYKAIYQLGYGSHLADDVYYSATSPMLKMMEFLLDRVSLSKLTCSTSSCGFADLLSFSSSAQILLILHLLFSIFAMILSYCWAGRSISRIFLINGNNSLLLSPQLINDNVLLINLLRKRY